MFECSIVLCTQTLVIPEMGAKVLYISIIVGVL